MSAESQRHIHSSMFLKPVRSGFFIDDLQEIGKEIADKFTGYGKHLHQTLDISWSNHSWPQGSSEKRKLGHGEMAVVISRTAEESVPDIAHILMTRKDLYHLFLLSLTSMSKREQRNSEATLNSVSIANFRESEGLYRPGFPYETTSLDFLEPTKAGVLSLHACEKLDTARIRDLLNLICVQKYMDFKRTDVDEDGKTLKLPDNPGGPSQEKDPADWWKSDDFTPPWEE